MRNAGNTSISQGVHKIWTDMAILGHNRVPSLQSWCAAANLIYILLINIITIIGRHASLLLLLRYSIRNHLLLARIFACICLQTGLFCFHISLCIFLFELHQSRIHQASPSEWAPINRSSRWTGTHILIPGFWLQRHFLQSKTLGHIDTMESSGVLYHRSYAHSNFVVGSWIYGREILLFRRRNTMYFWFV